MEKLTAKDKVIDASIHLMTGRGYAATTVDDIVREADVAKGSFYHAFKSKEDLAITALESYLQRGLAILADGPYVHLDDPVEKALGFVQYIEDKSPELWSHGCLLGSLAIEIGESQPAVLNQIDRLFRWFERGLENIFAPALAARGVTMVSGRDLALHLTAVVEGSIITARSHKNPDYLRDGIRHYRTYLGLLLQ